MEGWPVTLTEPEQRKMPFAEKRRKTNVYCERRHFF